MPSHWPAVTAILNTYQTAHLLPRSLASILIQRETMGPGMMEVIVADDASTDVTPQVLADWAPRFDQAAIPFTAFRLAENSGYQCVPKNRAIELAKGDYIRFLDADNEWLPGSLRTLYNALEAGDVWDDVAYGRREYIIDPGAIVPSTLTEGPSTFTPHDPTRLAQSCYLNYIDTSDFLISRGALWYLYEHTGWMWNETYRRFADWELVTRAANLDQLVGIAPLRFKAIDSIVTRYHWTGENLQLKRPLHETPQPKSLTTGEIFK